ncbi:MAG: addiction module protein [Opitutales bacterium]|nr:addiction module protein [Opitutales bacterium]
MTSLNTVEKLALELPESQRASLAMHILKSLPALHSERDGGVAEALRRDAEMEANPSVGLSLELDQKVRERSKR